jgi:hypothetical protein
MEAARTKSEGSFRGAVGRLQQGQSGEAKLPLRLSMMGDDIMRPSLSAFPACELGGRFSRDCMWTYTVLFEWGSRL